MTGAVFIFKYALLQKILLTATVGNPYKFKTAYKQYIRHTYKLVMFQISRPK